MNHSVSDRGTLAAEVDNSEITQALALSNDIFPSIPPDQHVSSGNRYVAFLSKFNKEAGPSARIIKQELVKSLAGDEIFLDCDNLRNLNQLTEHVKSSCCIVSLITKNYFKRPWCVFELVLANQLKIPIINVRLTNLDDNEFKKESFDELTSISKHFLKRSDWSLLADQGVGFNDVKLALKASKDSISLEIPINSDSTTLSFFIQKLQIEIEECKYVAMEPNDVKDNIIIKAGEECDSETRLTQYLKDMYGIKTGIPSASSMMNHTACIVLSDGIMNEAETLIKLFNAKQSHIPVLLLNMDCNGRKKVKKYEFYLSKQRVNDVFKGNDVLRRIGDGMMLEDVYGLILWLMEHRSYQMGSDDFSFAMIGEILAQISQPSANFMINTTIPETEKYKIYFSVPPSMSFNDVLGLKKLIDLVKVCSSIEVNIGLLPTLDACKRKIAQCDCFVHVLCSNSKNEPFKYWQILELSVAISNKIPISYLNLKDSTNPNANFEEWDWPTGQVDGWNLMKPVEWEFLYLKQLEIEQVYGFLSQLREAPSFEINIRQPEKTLQRKMLGFLEVLPGFM